MKRRTLNKERKNIIVKIIKENSDLFCEHNDSRF